MQTNCILNSLQLCELFSELIANKIFQFTVVLFIYFYDQFVAPEIRHSRCQMWVLSVNNQHIMKRREQDFDKTFT